MNKTITSNIAGYVFHIDENAYHKLDAYLNTIRKYFADSQGREEIIADIEARLAEMLQERIGDLKQVVTLDDVNHVIQIMGQPEAFIDDDEEAEWKENRSEKPESGPKRLMRDPDNRIIGGVCSGVSHYLGINDPIWLRLALVLAVLFAGTGILLYIILWAIIPEARSTADKLQMRGESVTVSNIEKRVNEELETVKNKWNDMHGNRGTGRKVGDFVHRLITLAISLVSMFFKFIAKLIGFAFLVVGLLGFASIVGLVFSFPDMMHVTSDGIVGTVMISELLSGLFNSDVQLHVFRFAVLCAWGIPLLLLAYVGAKLMTNIRNRNRFVVLPLISLWIIGLITALVIGFQVQQNYALKSTDTEVVNLEPTEQDEALYLDVAKKNGVAAEAEQFDVMFFNLWVISDSDTFYGKPTLDVTKSPDSRIHLVIKRSARGTSKKLANEEALNIDYRFSLTDSLLLFDPYFDLGETAKWKDQNVELELQIPEGQVVHLSSDLIKIIYDIENVNHTYDGDMVNRRWVMKSYGLECVDCEGLKGPKFQDDEDEFDSESRQRELEDRQRELELERQRIERELQQQEREMQRLQKKQDAAGKNEEADASSEEIIIKRVINARYWIDPNTIRQVRISYPG